MDVQALRIQQATSKGWCNTLDLEQNIQTQIENALISKLPNLDIRETPTGHCEAAFTIWNEVHGNNINMSTEAYAAKKLVKQYFLGTFDIEYLAKSFQLMKLHYTKTIGTFEWLDWCANIHTNFSLDLVNKLNEYNSIIKQSPEQNIKQIIKQIK